MDKITFTRPVNVFSGAIRWVLSCRDYLARKYVAIKQFDREKLLTWAAKYNRSQWCYFTAAFIFLFLAVFSSISESNLLLIGTIAFLGLFREMWNMFQRVWDHNIGKAIVLVVYAGTANAALAFAAIKINVITGIEPEPFTFTLGFTTLVMLPFWLTISNVFFLLIGLILANLLLFISIPFKILGVRLPVHWEDTHRAGTTMLLRICLIPLVIYTLFTFISPYFTKIEGIETDAITATTDVNDPPTALEPTNEPEKEKTFSEAMKELSDLVQGSEQQGQSADPSKTQKHSVINELIADFIFYFESYKFSACKKTSEQHSVIIDDFSVLLITPDENAQYGYQYEIAACTPVYSDISNEEAIGQ
ncbi:MAG: hypothetical protein WA981_04705 [Glaciecola sp.]